MDQLDIQITPKLICDFLDVIRNAIIIIDAQQRIIFTNSWADKMFRATKNKMYGLDVRTVFMPEDREILASNIIDITRREREFESEALLQRLDGSSFPCLVATTFFFWDNGTEGMAFTIHDLTEVKSIEKALRRSERIAFLGTLINDISHQIRNPVMVIGGLARRMESLHVSSEITATIIRETGRLETLLATLDNFIRLPPSQTKKINFMELQKATVLFLEEKMSKSDCRWKCTYDPNISDKCLFIDKKLLLEAIWEIVLNSYESYDKDTVEKNILLHFSLSTDIKFPYVITITDKGHGISEKILPIVFDHFFSNKTNHIGMGLTFAQRIVDQQKGYLSIQSQLNQGTTVSMCLQNERRRIIRTEKMIKEV
jgi:PAS domain S-box-containing protein